VADSKHIIDLKPVMMTDEEWRLYNEICASYDDPPSQHGKDLFHDLFDADADGIITLLKPPKRQTTFEVVFFLSNLMMQQHLRLMQQQVHEACQEMARKTTELDDKLKKLSVNKKNK
jgi:hypothetical protein